MSLRCLAIWRLTAPTVRHSRAAGPARALLADKGHDADGFRSALAERNLEVRIPSKSNRKIQIPHDRQLYRKRHKIENMFAKLKDWR